MIKIPKRLNDNHHFCKSNLKQIKTLLPFNRKPHKMVKHTQTIRLPTNCLSMFDYFMGLALKRLTLK